MNEYNKGLIQKRSTEIKLFQRNQINRAFKELDVLFK